MENVSIGISACLLGRAVRYDGGHRLDPFITGTLGDIFQWVPLCPETGCGLPVPREPMHLVAGSDSPRLITLETGIDHTDALESWTQAQLAALVDKPVCGFIFKARSPSCGLAGVEVTGSTETGPGLFARAFITRFPHLPVIDDTLVHKTRALEDFIARAHSIQTNC